MREADLMARAGDYVLGLMGENDRQRAERDLEVDPDFRDAVLRVAERMHLLDLNPAAATHPDFWSAISARIGDLPQMRSNEGRAIPSRSRPAHHVDGFTLAALLGATFLAGYIAGLATPYIW